MLFLLFFLKKKKKKENIIIFLNINIEKNIYIYIGKV